MPNTLDDFEKIAVLRRSLDAVNSRIAKASSIRPLCNSDMKKREALPSLEIAKGRIEKEIQQLKTEFEQYLSEMPVDGQYAFCDHMCRQALKFHYLNEMPWTAAIMKAGLNMNQQNFRRDICVPLIILDYISQSRTIDKVYQNEREII